MNPTDNFAASGALPSEAPSTAPAEALAAPPGGSSRAEGQKKAGKPMNIELLRRIVERLDNFTLDEFRERCYQYTRRRAAAARERGQARAGAGDRSRRPS